MGTPRPGKNQENQQAEPDKKATHQTRDQAKRESKGHPAGRVSPSDLWGGRIFISQASRISHEQKPRRSGTSRLTAGQWPPVNILNKLQLTLSRGPLTNNNNRQRTSRPDWIGLDWIGLRKTH